MTSSGWVIVAIGSGAVEAAGVIKSADTSWPLEARFDDIYRQVSSVFEIHGVGARDFFVCEGPAPLVTDPHGSMKVERVRGIFEGVSRAKNVAVLGRVNPRTIQTEILGLHGPQLARRVVKDSARKVAETLSGGTLAHSCAPRSRGPLSQDVIDAYLLGIWSEPLIRRALTTGMNVREALDRTVRRKSSTRGKTGAECREGWTKLLQTKGR